MHSAKLLIYTFFCFQLSIGFAFADLRRDTLASFEKLRLNEIALKLPEEMRSLDATLATADMYYQLSEQKNADRYYQLAAQKMALIQRRLQESATPGLQTPSADSALKEDPATVIPPTDSAILVQKTISSAPPPLKYHNQLFCLMIPSSRSILALTAWLEPPETIPFLKEIPCVWLPPSLESAEHNLRQ